MEELNQTRFNNGTHNFFQTVYSNAGHDQLFYGLSLKDPRVPLIFHSFSSRKFFWSNHIHHNHRAKENLVREMI